MLNHTINPMTHKWVQQAAIVLAEAFQNEPVSVAVYKDYTPERRVRALTTDFTAELLVCLRRGYPVQVNDDGKVIAAAVIYPPGTYPIPLIDQITIQMKSLIWNGLNNLISWLKWLKEADKRRPTEPHYYLEYLGVRPGYQGRGYGSAIMNHLVAKADEISTGCYLENADPRNVAFYQRSGFQVIEEKDVGGVHTWFMFRPPR